MSLSKTPEHSVLSSNDVSWNPVIESPTIKQNELKKHLQDVEMEFSLVNTLTGILNDHCIYALR